MQPLDFESLAARDDVWARETIHAVDADRFADAREQIDAGLTWAVGAIVTDSRDRVLLVREDEQWLAPGGKVEPGETREEALVREVREETGVAVAVERPVAVTDVAFEYDDERVSFAFAHYVAVPETTALASDPGLADEDIDTVAWKATVPENTVDREVVVAVR
ncbi:NUDIX hydrolase [Halorientalis brevis]|uniref:NUDIX hydrolase n=1 Tax=Halorientalis brevis TaxID=1126241 RepID=A0ABD6CFE2_9EURY|nr:NUDIX domain-containing protein [Halorientalis brevis]